MHKIQGIPLPSQLDEIAAVVGSGGVVVLPTDTIYGFHASAFNTAAIERIVAVKARQSDSPFIVLASEIEELTTCGVVWSSNVREVLEKIWPASLTAVLPITQPTVASRGHLTLACRVPDHWIRELLRRSGPLVSTSLNRSNESPHQSIPVDVSRLAEDVNLIVDAGPLAGHASTVVDFTVDEPRVLRQGEYPFAQNLWKRPRISL